jgi:hypothetical protein
LLNTTLSAAGATSRLDAFQALYAPGMTEHVARWRQPANWLGELARIRSYMQARPTAVLGHIASKFAPAGTAQLTLHVDDQAEGVIQVNSIVLDAGTAGVSSAPYPWSGVYMRGVPVTVTARPRDGFRFAGWIDSAGSGGVDPDQASVSVSLSGARSLQAIFEPELCPVDFDESGVVDTGDVALALLDFGPCPGCMADLDDSGEVDFADVALILLDFGPCS